MPSAFLSPPPGHVDRRGETPRVPPQAPGRTRTEHEVQPGARTRGVCAYRAASSGRGRGSPHPSSSLGPGPPPSPLAVQQGGKTEEWGEVVPGDFTLFEASVFRYRHPRGFSFLLHRHLPPSPAGQPGRAGEPGKGSLSAEDSSGLAPGSQRQQQAEEQSLQPAPQRPCPASGRSQGSSSPFSPGQRVPSRRWTLRLGHTGKGERRQRGTSTVTHSESRRLSATRMRLAGRK